MPIDLIIEDKRLNETDYTVIRENGVTRRYTEADRQRLGRQIRSVLRPSQEELAAKGRVAGGQPSRADVDKSEFVTSQSNSPLMRFFTRAANSATGRKSA